MKRHFWHLTQIACALCVCSWSLGHDNLLVFRSPNLQAYFSLTQIHKTFTHKKKLHEYTSEVHSDLQLVPGKRFWSWQKELNQKGGLTYVAQKTKRVVASGRSQTYICKLPGTGWRGPCSLRLEERQRTAPHPAHKRVLQKSHHPVQSFQPLRKNRGKSPLAAAVLLCVATAGRCWSQPCHTQPRESSAPTARAELHPIPTEDASARTCCTAKDFTY